MINITITETIERKVTQPPEWKVTGEDEAGKSTFGYTPEVEVTGIERIIRLEQNVDTLDLRKVIDAINSAPRRKHRKKAA